MAVTLEATAPGQWKLSGELNFASVPDAWEKLRPLVARPGRVTVSLAGVARSNSAGLGLLLEGLAHARRAECDLRYTALPAALMDLAKVSNLEGLIGAALV